MVLRGNHAWDPVTLNGQIDALLAVTRQYDGPSIKRKLQELIPDYAPQM
jgi:hypothetical protein